MVDTRNLMAIQRVRHDKLRNQIIDHAVEWVKQAKCKCNIKLKNRRKDYILDRLRDCKHMQKDRINKFGDEIDKQFTDIVSVGTVALEKTIGRKLPEWKESIKKGDF